MGMDLETLAATAAELAQRMQVLASAPALPGDSARLWLEHRAECLALTELIAGGLLMVVTPQ